MSRKFYIFLILLFAFALKAKAQNWSALNSGFNDEVYAVTVYQGKIYAAGKFVQAGSTQVNHIAKWTGTEWVALGSGMNDDVFSLCVYNGSLYAGGDFTLAGGIPAQRIAKWNDTAWSPVGSGINGEVFALIKYQGSLIVAGDFSNAGGTSANNIAQWSGSSWSAMGTGLSGIVRALAEKGNNLAAGGDFNNNIAEWNGSSWNSVGSGPGNRVNALIYYNNELTAGGNFNGNIRKWNGSSWQVLGGGLDNKVNALTTYRGAMVIGGEFTHGDPSGSNITLNRIALWNNGWVQLGSGMDHEMYALASKDSYRLIAGGKFSNAGGVSANNIAVWDKTHRISGTVTNVFDNAVSSGIVKAIRLDSATMKIIVADSAEVQLDGSYILNNVPVTSHLVIGFPDDELEDNFVPTYYPSNIRWMESPWFTADTNTTNANITVKSYTNSVNPGSIRGKANLSFVSPYPEPEQFAGAIIYAKLSNDFKGFSISNSISRFDVSSLAEGNYEITVDRLGFLPQVRNVDLNFSQGFVIDSVNFLLKPAEIITIHETENEIPHEYVLHQNYPNPFNPATTISFSLKNRAFVKLGVYDFLGRKVSELYNKTAEQGKHSLSWNAERFSTGVYFYKIEVVPLNGSKGFTETKKMLLIK